MAYEPMAWAMVESRQASLKQFPGYPFTSEGTEGHLLLRLRGYRDGVLVGQDMEFGADEKPIAIQIATMFLGRPFDAP